MQSILRLLIRERRCAACHEPFVPERAEEACPACAARLQPRTGGYCPTCGELASWPSLPPSPCGQCLSKPPPWNGFAFFAAHDGLLRELLIRLKFGHEPGLGGPLGRLLVGRIPPDLAVDAVVPVPLPDDRLRRRGYNQAMELARPIAKRLTPGRAPQHGLLRRLTAGVPQTKLPRAVRRKNLTEAFAAAPQAAGLRILLVDDVLTTGATLEAATLALLKAGAADVRIAACARTPRRASI